MACSMCCKICYKTRNLWQGLKLKQNYFSAHRFVGLVIFDGEGRSLISLYSYSLSFASSLLHCCAAQEFPIDSFLASLAPPLWVGGLVPPYCYAAKECLLDTASAFSQVWELMCSNIWELFVEDILWPNESIGGGLHDISCIRAYS